MAPNPADFGQPVTLTLTGRADQTLTLQLVDNTGHLHHTQVLRPLKAAEQPPADTCQLRVTGAGTSPLHTRLVLTR